MRKRLLAVALVGLIAVTGRADDPKSTQDKKEKPAASLKVGDPAPGLKVSKWLQGEEVKEFKPGKVYVVEFWATWCGPCIAFMPDLAELQAEYKDQGVTCIGFSARDLLGVSDNTEEKVAAFVKKRGPKLKYTFAYADDNTTSDAWMKAAGRDALPCSFVVDKTGRIAYIGNPIYLGVVLPLVVAGTLKPQAVSEEVGKIEKEYRAISFWPDDKTHKVHKAGLKALAEFEVKYPRLANNPIFVKIKLSFLPEVGEIDEAKTVAEAIVAKAIKQSNPSSLRQVAALLRNGPGKESKELLAVAVKAAEAAVQVAGDDDALALIDLAQTYCASGNKARAREYAHKAGQLPGDKAGMLLMLAETYFAIGDKAEATKYARKAVAAAAGESAKVKQYIEEQALKFLDK